MTWHTSIRDLRPIKDLGLPGLTAATTNEVQTDWLYDFLRAHDISWETGIASRCDQRGTEYVELLLAGPRATEGLDERLVTIATSERLCKSAYQEVLLKFLDGRKHIVWRIEPELHSRERNPFLTAWHVYSRLTAYDAP